MAGPRIADKVNSAGRVKDPGLKWVRENQAFIATERNSGGWVEDGCIEKQQVSAASRHGKLASQR
jgi:hypothetical protein